MIWFKLVDNFKFFCGNDTDREYRTTLQNFGLRVRNVVYAIEVLDNSGSGAKIGIRHDQGASDNLNIMETLGLPIAVANVAAPLVVQGQIGETTSKVLLPFFMPVVLANGTTANQWVLATIYVGGKPF